MPSVQPDNTDPMPLPRSPHSMAAILLRFVGWLTLSVAVMALLWSQ
jgi:hypothetical protein